MATYVRFDKDNVILPSFVKKSLVGQKKTNKMSPTRLQKLMDAEIQGSQDEFAMPQLLQQPIEFKAAPAPSQLPITEGIHQKTVEKKKQHFHQNGNHPIINNKEYTKGNAKGDMKKRQQPQKLPVYQAPPFVQFVPQVFHTDYAWYNGTWVPVHHHVALVPHYLM